MTFVHVQFLLLTPMVPFFHYKCCRSPTLSGTVFVYIYHFSSLLPFYPSYCVTVCTFYKSVFFVRTVGVDCASPSAASSTGPHDTGHLGKPLCVQLCLIKPSQTCHLASFSTYRLLTLHTGQGELCHHSKAELEKSLLHILSQMMRNYVLCW